MKRSIAAASAVLAVGLYGQALAADGAAIFKAKCSPCHGAQGQGTAMAPAFKGNEFVKTSDEAQIAHVIKNGREGAAKKYKQFAIAMPKQTLSDDEVEAVITQLKTIAGS